MCPTLCDPMDCSTPGFPVLHYLLEFAQTHVHWVSDITQSSHPLSPPSPTEIFPSIKVFSNELTLCIRWPEFWSFSFSISPSNKYLGLISFKIDWFDLLTLQGILKSFPVSQLFASSGQSFGASVSASVLPMNIQDWFPLGWTGLISLVFKGLFKSPPIPQFKSINSSGLSFLYGPAVPS